MRALLVVVAGASLAQPCPAPRRADPETWLFADCHVADINADFTRARELYDGCVEARDSARLERDACLYQAAAALDECASTPAPLGSDQDLWAWGLAGGLAVAAPVGFCSIGVECGPGYAPWVAAGVSLGVVALLGWWVD